MKERLFKFAICIILAPVISVILLLLAIMMVFLPLIALFAPEVIELK